MFSPKQLDTVFKQPKSFRFWGTSSPDTLLSVSLRKIQIFLISIIKSDSYMNVHEHALESRFQLNFLAPINMQPKRLELLLYWLKGFSFWGDFVLGLPTIFIVQRN